MGWISSKTSRLNFYSKRLGKDFKDNESFTRTMLLFASAIITGVLANAASDYIRNSDNPLHVAWPLIASGLVFVIVLALIFHNEIRRIRRRIGLDISYIEIGPSDSQAYVYHQVSQFLSTAKESVIVVNSATPERHMTDAPSCDAREFYLKTLSRLASRNPGFVYKRVWQYKDLSKLQEELVVHFESKEFQDHATGVADIRHKGNESAVMYVAPATRLGTFMLIDNDKLVWQINEYCESSLGPEGKRDTDRTMLRGVFLIQDPGHKVTSHFIDFTKRILQRATYLPDSKLRLLASGQKNATEIASPEKVYGDTSQNQQSKSPDQNKEKDRVVDVKPSKTKEGRKPKKAKK